MTVIAGPWGQDDLDDVVAVLIEGEGRSRRFLPIARDLAEAINDRRVASFNTFMSLAPRERALMAPLFIAGHVGAHLPACAEIDFGARKQITVASPIRLAR